MRSLFRLVVPVIAEQVLHMMVGFSDTILSGHYLGESELAAINLMNYGMWLMYTVFAFVGIGATAMVARFVGSDDSDSARKVTHQALLIGSMLAIGMTVVGFLGAGKLVELEELHSDAAQFAKHYFWIVLAVSPWMMIQEVGVACLRGAGDTVSGLVAMLILNAVNIGVGWALVRGWGPLPELGWYGLAIGTAVGQVVGGSIILWLLVRKKSRLRIRWRGMRPDKALIRRLMRIGLPGGIDSMAVVFFHLWYLSIINALGQLQAAAHGVGVRCESIAYHPGYAFHVAAATLVGQYLGMQDFRKARQSVWVTLGVGMVLWCGAGAIFFFAPEAVTNIFVNQEKQPGVIKLTASLLPIVAFAMPALAMTTVFSGGLRGAGDTRIPLMITFTGLVLVRIPGSYFLAYETVDIEWLGIHIGGLGLGVVGAWYAMVADLWLRGLLILARFLHGGWQRIKV